MRSAFGRMANDADYEAEARAIDREFSSARDGGLMIAFGWSEEEPRPR